MLYNAMPCCAMLCHAVIHLHCPLRIEWIWDRLKHLQEWQKAQKGRIPQYLALIDGSVWTRRVTSRECGECRRWLTWMRHFFALLLPWVIWKHGKTGAHARSLMLFAHTLRTLHPVILDVPGNFESWADYNSKDGEWCLSKSGRYLHLMESYASLEAWTHCPNLSNKVRSPNEIRVIVQENITSLSKLWPAPRQPWLCILQPRVKIIIIIIRNMTWHLCEDFACPL